MKSLNHIWLIALKDLKIFAKDRASVFFFVIFPFLLFLKGSRSPGPAAMH